MAHNIGVHFRLANFTAIRFECRRSGRNMPDPRERFEGLPHERGLCRTAGDAASVQYVADYLATADGLQLTKAFMQIPSAKLRRAIVNLVEQLANSEDQ
jgi:hypothetical protein